MYMKFTFFFKLLTIHGEKCGNNYIIYSIQSVAKCQKKNTSRERLKKGMKLNVCINLQNFKSKYAQKLSHRRQIKIINNKNG